MPLKTLITLLSLGGLAAVAADSPPTAGVVLWLKADAPGDAMDAGGRVRVWRNQLASGGDAVQAEWKRQPVLQRSADGLAAVAFDGDDDFLHLPDLQLGNDFSAFLAIDAAPQTTGGSVWRGILCGDADALRPQSRQYAFMLPEGSQPRQCIVQVPSALANPGFERLTGGPQLPQRSPFAVIGFGVRSGKSPELCLRQQGHLTRKTIAGGLPKEMSKGYTLGQGGNVAARKTMRHFRGRLAEILVYDRCLPEAEALRVEGYLSAKYRVSMAPHPPLAGLEVWIRPDLQPPAEGPEVVRLSPVKVGSMRNEGGKVVRLLQPAADQRPTFMPSLAAARLRFDAESWLVLEKWKPADGSTMLAAVIEPSGDFRIVSDWPSVASEGKLGGFRGELHEWLGYARALSPDQRQQAVRYLTDRHQPPTDPRRFRNGQLVFQNGYTDQPYVVECRDGSWLCVMTTSTLAEGGADRTLVTCRSRDGGATWTEPVANVEPPLLQQPSWGTLLVAPSGRVFVFYNVKDNRTDVPGKLVFCFRYSDDHGATWSSRRFALPLPRLPQDQPNQAPNGWSVCPPLVKDGAAFLSFTRFVPPGRSLGCGTVYRSANLLGEPDAAKIGWEVLPDDRGALRCESIASNMQEEHILAPLREPGHLYCIWRTQIGHPVESYSRDGGRTWSPPEPARIGDNGPAIPQPVACTMPVALGNGRFLLWHHFASGPEHGRAYHPRNTVWLSAGQERSGRIVWSYPELLLYDDHLPVNGTGMSYPGFLVRDDQITVLTTDKMSARQFRIAPSLLDGLWKQLAGEPVPLPSAASVVAGRPASMKTPSLCDDGLTWHLDIDFALSGQDQILSELRQSDHEEHALAQVVIPAGSRTLRLSLWDRLGRCAQLELPADLLQPGKRHRATFVVEGGAHLVIPIVDGRIPVADKTPTHGYYRLPDDFAWNDLSPLTVELGKATATNVQTCQVFDRPLTVSQAISMHRAALERD